MFWIFLWVVLSLAILGAFAWTSRILIQQKQVWRAFAKKHNLKYDSRKMLESPFVEGKFVPYYLNLFSEEQTTNDVRGIRFRSVIEIVMKSNMPVNGLAASPSMREITAGMEMGEAIFLTDDNWSGDHILRCQSPDLMTAYLGKGARLKRLDSFLKIKSGGAIFIFDRNTMLVRIETADPLHNMERLEKLAAKMKSLAGQMAPDKEEIARLTGAQPQAEKTVSEAPESASEDANSEKP